MYVKLTFLLYQTAFPVERQQSTSKGDSSSAPPFCSSVYSVMDSLVPLFLHATKMIHVPEPGAGLAREREREGKRERRESHGPCSLQELAVQGIDHRRR